MSESFIKFKNRSFWIRVIKSALIGFAVGTLFAGVFLLLSKFEILKMKPIFSLPIGIAALLLSGGGTYFLLRSSDKALAKRLDEQFSLNEKVQTMLAYKEERGTIYTLQREDAEKSLASVPAKRLKFKNLWIYAVCAVIGAGSLTAAFVASPKETPPPIVNEEAWELKGMQAAALEELIGYVDASAMQSPYKESVSLSLTDLLAELRLAETVNAKDAALEKAVDAIYAQTDASSTAVELMDTLWACDSESVKQLAETLNYYEWPKADEWDTFSEELTDFRTSFVHIDTVTENPDASKMAADTAVLLLRVESNVTVSLARAGVPAEDGLYKALTRLATANEESETGTHLYGFSTLSGLCETIGYETSQKELDATFAVLGAEIFNALEQHAANTSTGEYAMTTLKDLFGGRLPAFERPNFYVSTPTDPENPEGEANNGGQQGGIGDGAVYGSDDLVLDPLTNTYVEYGTILDKYYSLMFGKVNDGGYTEEEKAAMEKYFAILYGGFDEDEGE